MLDKLKLEHSNQTERDFEMICEDCSFFIDEICTDDMEGYINKETGLPVCRYNPNATLREKAERGHCNCCGFDVEDMAEILHELLAALRHVDRKFGHKFNCADADIVEGAIANAEKPQA